MYQGARVLKQKIIFDLNRGEKSIIKRVIFSFVGQFTFYN